MRKLFPIWLFLLLAFIAAPVFAAAAPAASASSASGVGVTLTPEQARQALAVLNDPPRRRILRVGVGIKKPRLARGF
ncbi:hypothetical protein, partial [Paraburkholderia dipogonis]|uniref:hypothetical protein n=1 Tax=Paraburkholderia dipogonis TaxID=1211383 RepID=UPI00361751A4